MIHWWIEEEVPARNCDARAVCVCCVASSSSRRALFQARDSVLIRQPLLEQREWIIVYYMCMGRGERGSENRRGIVCLCVCVCYVYKYVMPVIRELASIAHKNTPKLTKQHQRKAPFTCTTNGCV